MSDPFFIPYSDVQVGDHAERESVLSDESVRRFSAVIGDTDSFHVSDESAARTVFKTRIAHGIHLATFISTLVGQKLRGLEQFTAPRRTTSKSQSTLERRFKLR